MNEAEEFEFRLRAEKERGGQFQRPKDALDNPNMVTEGQSFGQNALAGAGKAFVDLGRGIGQITGFIPSSEIDEIQERDEPLMKTGGGVAGNILGNVATMLPAALFPGAASIPGAGITGAAMGAITPTKTDESRMQNMAVGAASGVLGSAATKGISRVLNPQTREAVRLLLNEGVTPTPGQILGGTAQKIEDKLTSAPILGDVISSAREKGLNEFQRAAYRRALDPINAQAPQQTGREGITAVRDALSSAYNTLASKLSFKADNQFNSSLTQLRQMAQTLPPQQQQAFDSVIATQLTGKMTPAGLMNGETLKAVESELGRLARGYRGDASFDNRQLGDAISQVQRLVRENLSRMNPQYADELSSINAGYANYARLRDAAGRSGADMGNFTPSQLAAAVRGGDASVGKGGYATGNALMQDLSDAGKSVLSQKYPDSGTAGRLSMPALLAGAGAGAGALLAPKTAAVMGAAALPYLPGGRQVIAAALARRPELARQLATMLRDTAPQIGMATSAYGVQQ